MYKTAAALFALSLFAFPALAAPATGEPIKIGRIDAGNKMADYFIGHSNAAQLAVDEINAAGGINGRPLEILRRDAKFDPGTGVKQAEELVTKEKVSVLMTCESSATTLAVSTWAAQNKVPVINACSEADSIIWEKGNDYIFRTAQGGYMWVDAVLDEATKLYGDKLKNKRWAIVAPNFEFGQAVVRIFKMLVEQRGLNPQWVAEQWPVWQKLEAGSTIAALNHAEPDIIFNLLFENDLAKSIREGNKRGLYKNKIVIAPIVAIPDHVDLLGKEMPTGWVSIGFPAYEIQDANYLQFRKAYEARYKDKIKLYTVSGYDSIQAVAAALRAAKSTEPEKVRAALETTPFQAIFGEMRFRKIDHQANETFWVGVSGVKDGKAGLFNWHVENAADHSPPDAWILEQRAKANAGTATP